MFLILRGLSINGVWSIVLLFLRSMINQLSTLVHVTTQRPHMPGLNPVSISEGFVPPANWETMSHKYPDGNLVGPISQGCLILMSQSYLTFAIFAQQMGIPELQQIISGIQIANDIISLNASPIRPAQPNQYDTMATTIWIVVNPLIFQEVQVYLNTLFGPSFEIHRSIGQSPN